LELQFCGRLGVEFPRASHLVLGFRWREIVATHHWTAAAINRTVWRAITQYLGDGVIAFFCRAETHGNDAEREARGLILY
jgi:hypothetical protein